MYSLIKPLLFHLDAERAHDLALANLARLDKLGLAGLLGVRLPECPVEVMGLRFPNPVGLAAGLDKNADYLDGLARLGFGFLEVGTVTPRPQAGNDKPRLFRLPQGQAIINRMGFNNKGVDYLVERVKQARFDGVLGINIGKNKDTPNEHALDDYTIGMEKVYPHAGYITINVSSPNTPGLRDLQQIDAIGELVAGLKGVQARLADQHGRLVPMVVKIAPDLADDDLPALANTLAELGVEGIAATNTTLSRAGVEGLRYADEAGGLSGAPLRERADAVLDKLCVALDGRVPVIGIGGITRGEHAAHKLKLGASLVQVYSGLIYRGPGLVREAVEACCGGVA